VITGRLAPARVSSLFTTSRGHAPLSARVIFGTFRLVLFISPSSTDASFSGVSLLRFFFSFFFFFFFHFPRFIFTEPLELGRFKSNPFYSAALDFPNEVARFLSRATSQSLRLSSHPTSCLNGAPPFRRFPERAPRTLD